MAKLDFLDEGPERLFWAGVRAERDGADAVAAERLLEHERVMRETTQEPVRYGPREAMHRMGESVLATGVPRAFERLVVGVLDALSRALDAFTRWVQR